MTKHISWIVTIVSVGAIVGGIIWYAGRPGQYDAFASCIEESGAKFYGAFWCNHCQNQKAMFGRSSAKLPYIECSMPNGQGQTQVCEDANIESYPTWEFSDGTRRNGVVEMLELSTLTSCSATPDSER